METFQNLSDAEISYLVILAATLTGLVLFVANVVICKINERRKFRREDERRKMQAKVDAEHAAHELLEQQAATISGMAGFGLCGGAQSFFGGGGGGGSAVLLGMADLSRSPSQEIQLELVEEAPPEEPKLLDREHTGTQQRGADAGRSIVVSMTEKWSDGSTKDVIYAQKGYAGPWFDLATGEELNCYTSLVKRLDEIADDHTAQPTPSPESIFKALLHEITIKHGIPYGSSIPQKGLPAPDEK